MITLALDASTYAGSVALLDGTKVLAEESVAMKGAEHERLMPAVAACLARARTAVDDIERVVCGAGPGSFTSLRIAGAIAKGIASGVGVSLFAVPSMALIAGSGLKPARYITIVDALRGDVYVGLYDVEASRSIAEIEPPRLIAAAQLDELAGAYDAIRVSPSSEFAPIVAQPRAAAVGQLESMIFQRGPVDLATWEPAYGRLAEAQVRWETAHGKPLAAG